MTDNQEQSPKQMIELAIKGGADLEKLEKLLTLQERWEANEAKKAFVRAMTAFKSEAPLVFKDRTNKQYNSKYTSLGNLINTVNPILSKHGLSASWDIEQNGIIKVSCMIRHEQGHNESASASAPADVSGAKNVIQQIKSTITYLKAVTFESICGLASTDANLDDDGNMGAPISEEQLNKLLDILDNLPNSKEKKVKFLTFMGVNSPEEITTKNYEKAMAALKSAKEKTEKKETAK